MSPTPSRSPPASVTGRLSLAQMMTPSASFTGRLSLAQLMNPSDTQNPTWLAGQVSIQQVPPSNISQVLADQDAFSSSSMDSDHGEQSQMAPTSQTEVAVPSFPISFSGLPPQPSLSIVPFSMPQAPAGLYGLPSRPRELSCRPSISSHTTVVDSTGNSTPTVAGPSTSTAQIRPPSLIPAQPTRYLTWDELDRVWSKGAWLKLLNGKGIPHPRGGAGFLTRAWDVTRRHFRSDGPGVPIYPGEENLIPHPSCMRLKPRTRRVAITKFEYHTPPIPTIPILAPSTVTPIIPIPPPAQGEGGGTQPLPNHQHHQWLKLKTSRMI